MNGKIGFIILVLVFIFGLNLIYFSSFDSSYKFRRLLEVVFFAVVIILLFVFKDKIKKLISSV